MTSGVIERWLDEQRIYERAHPPLSRAAHDRRGCDDARRRLGGKAVLTTMDDLECLMKAITTLECDMEAIYLVAGHVIIEARAEKVDWSTIEVFTPFSVGLARDNAAKARRETSAKTPKLATAALRPLKGNPNPFLRLCALGTVACDLASTRLELFRLRGALIWELIEIDGIRPATIGERIGWTPSKVGREKGKYFTTATRLLIGHNGIGYDLDYIHNYLVQMTMVVRGEVNAPLCVIP